MLKGIRIRKESGGIMKPFFLTLTLLIAVLTLAVGVRVACRGIVAVHHITRGMRYKISVNGLMFGYVRTQRFTLETENQDAVVEFIKEVMKNPGFKLSTIRVAEVNTLRHLITSR